MASGAMRRLVAVAGAAALLTLTACGGQVDEADGPLVTNVQVNDADNLDGSVLAQPYDVPKVTLRDTAGAPFDVGAAATKPLTLVFFGYTNCPDICQVVMANLASAVSRLEASQRDQVGMVFVTTDPKRDTAAVLREYLDRFNPSFEGATGPLSSIVDLGGAMDVEIMKGEKLPSGGYEVAHGTQVVGLVPGREAPYVWTDGTDPQAFADDITTILDGQVEVR